MPAPMVESMTRREAMQAVAVGSAALLTGCGPPAHAATTTSGRETTVPRYLDAFFANIQWDEVNRRLETASRLRAVLAPV